MKIEMTLILLIYFIKSVYSSLQTFFLTNLSSTDEQLLYPILLGSISILCCIFVSKNEMRFDN